MKISYLLCTVIILFGCVNRNESNKSIQADLNSDIEENEYEEYIYDTILKNDYNLSYNVYDDSISGIKMQNITLSKDGYVIKELNEVSYPMLQKNLGYLGADFNDSFVLVQSYGSGNPHYMQLFNKKTGIEIDSGVWVDADETEEILLYIEDIYEDTEKLYIHDLKNKTKIIVNNFKGLNCDDLNSYNYIVIDTVTKDEITLKSNPEYCKTQLKKYRRHK